MSGKRGGYVPPTPRSTSAFKARAATWLFLFIATAALRAGIFWLRPGTFDWPLAILIVDVAALIPIACASVMGAILGAAFGSVALTALGIGLPVAALGWLAEKAVSRDFSGLMGQVCLLGIGVGFSIASFRRRDTFSRCLLLALALGALAGGIALLAERRLLGNAILVAAPYLVAACASWLLRSEWGQVAQAQA
jgi:hypothetical protein